MFGNSIDKDGFQRETTPMNPVSPYGCAKLFGYSIVRNYRHSYNLFLSNGILFNHESPRRGINFVTNKVVNEAVKSKLSLSQKLELGNLNAARDWGHAKDYVEGMWRILQADEPEDFVLSTNEYHSVREFIEKAFSSIKISTLLDKFSSFIIGNKSLTIESRYFFDDSYFFGVTCAARHVGIRSISLELSIWLIILNMLTSSSKLGAYPLFTSQVNTPS